MKRILVQLGLALALTTHAKPGVFVEVSHDTVNVWDTAFEWYCSGRFFSITRTSQDTIYVTQCDTVPGAFCYCHFDVCTRLTGLPPGDYVAVVTRRYDWLEIRTRNPQVRVQFTILTPSPLANSLSVLQSPCYHLPQAVPVSPGSRLRWRYSRLTLIHLTRLLPFSTRYLETVTYPWPYTVWPANWWHPWCKT